MNYTIHKTVYLTEKPCDDMPVYNANTELLIGHVWDQLEVTCDIGYRVNNGEKTFTAECQENKTWIADICHSK